MSLGWIKLHRRLLDHPRFTDEGWLRVWVALLLLANHSKDGQRRIFKGGEIVLKPGQLLTSRDSLARTAGLHPSSVERVLAKLKTEQQIEQQADNKSRLITILSWAEYQDTEQQIEQPANNSRTASEQPANTHKNVKKEKNDENGEKEASETWAPTALQERFNKIFRRKPTTRWDAKETKALKALEPINEEDVTLVERYYTQQIPADRDYRRRDLLTLLSNFNGEADRARKATNETRKPF